MRTRALLWVLTAAPLLLGGSAVSIGQTTITVGSGAACDFDAIQAGIDVAKDGDVVLVAAGEHVVTMPITFRGKAIAVRSEAGPEATTVRMGVPDDSRRASVVVFENNETDASILEGFTLTRGRSTWTTYLWPRMSKTYRPTARET